MLYNVYIILKQQTHVLPLTSVFNVAFYLCLKAPHCMHMRTSTKFGDKTFVDTMLKDGLTDAFNNYHMGITGNIFYTIRTLSQVEIRDVNHSCL